MPFIIILIGIILLIVAAKGTYNEFLYLLQGDFTGPNNFIFWIVSIAILGALGYIPKFQKVSISFMILVILVLFLKKGQGFFSQFQTALGGG